MLELWISIYTLRNKFADFLPWLICFFIMQNFTISGWLVHFKCFSIFNYVINELNYWHFTNIFVSQEFIFTCIIYEAFVHFDYMAPVGGLH